MEPRSDRAADSCGQQPGDDGGGVGANEGAGDPARLVPAAGRVDDDLIGCERPQPVPQRLARRQIAEAEDEVGSERLGPERTIRS